MGGIYDEGSSSVESHIHQHLLLLQRFAVQRLDLSVVELKWVSGEGVLIDKGTNLHTEEPWSTYSDGRLG